MLTLTEEAATQIRNVVAAPGSADTAGLRIADDAEGNLTLSLATMPDEDDLVIDDSGARLFLDPHAATILDDKTLHATTDPSGQVQFGIFDQRTDFA